ncbi:hypothetical protein D3C87_2103160 [compost metagenome]
MRKENPGIGNVPVLGFLFDNIRILSADISQRIAYGFSDVFAFMSSMLADQAYRSPGIFFEVRTACPYPQYFDNGSYDIGIAV